MVGAQKEIVVEKKKHIGWITLNRPEDKNTFTASFAKELNSALCELDNARDIWVLVLRGAGEHFSVGIDVKELKARKHQEYRELICSMNEHYHIIARMKKPIISSVRGYALANGAGLALSCDFTVASEDAKFGTTAINLGLSCLGPAVPLARLVGPKKTLELILTGKIISAADAEKLGLVNMVVPDKELEEATLRLADDLTSKSPLAVQAGKTGVYQMIDLPYHQSLDYSGELFASLCSTGDAQEGISAFLEKRNPIWKGE